MAIRARFKGGEGQFLIGIPARHLDEDEYAALSAEQRAEVRSSGLYDVKTDAEMAPRSESARAETPRTDAKKGGDS